MLRRILTIAIAVILTVTGLILMEQLLPHISFLIGYNVHSKGLLGYSYIHWLFAILSVMFFSWIGWVITPFIIKYLLKYSEMVASVLAKAPSADIIVSLIGVLVGLILANLIGAPFSRLPIVGSYIPIVLSLVLALTGAKVALHKSKDILGLFYRSRSRENVGDKITESREEPLPEDTVVDVAAMPAELAAGNKLLDTSVIIDGRIADILKTGFLEGNLVVPHFVLDELQRLSDSSDNLKRAKGRRGLDLIQEMQDMFHHVVVVKDIEYDMFQDVDSKLIALARDTGSVIVTNDFNLNKVASIQGIQILNINDLANAMKPVVIPGEEMTAYLLREGKENGQAIAYLQDGTMIVVEGGRKYIGNKIKVAVTSVLQTSAGRMIFAKVARNPM
ncbi:MAG: PIN/TRAM domain-containing protein [Acidaminococcaceae bacterium]|uniref:PIN/TRAM domain-containing protein n=1 Tax=Succiniclasticum sp. TaxID=2775030 RepID=UPI000E8DD708|nr:PIN domain-containing protein [Succiniclasticum sp.]MBP3812230.1 PIN/TRAM domain-containing protein [Acidaminococcaceae bacterium]MBR1495300.1 PIN/TRAM domain-containing protein [Acidaminococcaceae bacterium]MBR1660966.1 PIN/TRAM domain-containing protein [Acidaminococcaceae bacterium]MDY6292115.1 PIN/TRAM domain-containing protein [Succiniclasticum sp.]HAT98736.1 PIN/TRAM domain-containing protein [Acidaminococcaceae bacterium]